MDQRLEQRIRELAASYVATTIQCRDIYAQAAQDGAITYDDIFYLGAVNVASSEILESLIEICQAPLHKEPVNRQIHFVVQDDPVFRDTISDLGYHLLAKMYHCTREEAEEKFYRIQEKVSTYHNDKLKERQQ